MAWEFARGHREKHPLYGKWHWHKRRNKYGMVPEWANDFWAFVEGVGERPSEKHNLRRLKPTVQMGPDNFEWSETYYDGNQAAYMREYRKRRPENVRNTELKKMYGITLDEYNTMFEEQNGGCAICGGTQTNERFKNLAVDHCHDTGKIRGLLCNNCNLAVGKIDHSIEAARRMVEYLSDE